MKRILLLLMVVAAGVIAAHAKYIPSPIVRYKIEARLDADAKTVQAHEVIQWQNQSGDAIPELQFHLYLNAFKNAYSTFFREGGAESRRTSFWGDSRSWGYEQIHNIKVDGEDLTARMQYIQPDDGNPYDQTVMRLPLTMPLAPGQTVSIEVTWTSKLPRLFARTGWHDNFFLVAQWFPKPCVYEAAGVRHRQQGGWNCHQFHTSTEFYADYGDWDVTLTAPRDFELAATGALRNQQDNADGSTTYNFVQEDVHDFAWTTQPKYQAVKVERWFKADQEVSPAELQEWAEKTGVSPDEARLQDVKVTVFIQREHMEQLERHFRAAFNGIKWFGLWYGKYPYDVLTVVDPPYGGEGASGMEYPTFITAGTDYIAAKHELSPEGVIVHEFGHQFWYGLVGNNEFEEAWLDEGFNSYSTGKVLEKAYGPNYKYERLAGIPIPARRWVDLPVPRYPWKGVGDVGIGQYWEYVPLPQKYGRQAIYWEEASTDSMERYAWLDLDRDSYRVQAYAKPELTLRTLEGLLGQAWPKVMRTYHQRWRFKHPDAQDFADTVQEISGRDMKWFFDQTLYQTGKLNYAVSFTAGQAPRMEGFFDSNGTPALGAPADTSRENESEVLVRRLGDFKFPVTIRVKFDDGSERRERWDGQYRWQKFKYAGKKVVFAEVDPDFAWKLEIPRTDNLVEASPVRFAPVKWYLRWIVWLENVLSAFSFFG